MPTQKRESGKNYIGLLNDKTETRRAVEAPAGTGRRMRRYFAGLLAALFRRNRGDAR